MKNNKKRFTLGICLALIAAFAIGGTVAYLSAKTGTVKNDFTPVTITPEIDEKVENNVKTYAKVNNKSNTDVYIRADVIITWKNTTTQEVLPVKDTDYSIKWNETDWFNEGGILYHKAKVSENGSTANIFTDCKPIVNPPKDGYTLNVEILAQAVQATPAQAVQELWSDVKVDSTGALVPVAVKN